MVQMDNTIRYICIRNKSLQSNIVLRSYRRRKQHESEWVYLFPCRIFYYRS